MLIEVDVPCPMPEDPMLADVAASLRHAGGWGFLVDADWRLVYFADELRLSFGASMEMVPILLGVHLFGPENVGLSIEYRFGPNRPEAWCEHFTGVGGLVLADTPGGPDELREVVDPSLRDLVDGLTADPAAARPFSTFGTGVGGRYEVRHTAVRIRDGEGQLRGTVLYAKPAAGMSILATLVFERDQRLLTRMQQVVKAGRRPAAILFGDLESSSALARRLSTASNFALGRRIVRAADRCVVDAGGLPGRHVGDGVVAFFPAETFESESAAARACISAARAVRTAMTDVAVRSDLAPDEVVMRFGLHWGSTLYMGSIITSARSEVTALGDEANEAARIEACATGGHTLASKDLIERLDPNDAGHLGIDPDHQLYTRLADLTTATEKARRDAPAIAVCAV